METLENINTRSVAFYTLGCKLNYSETSTISRMFEEKGYKKVDFNDTPDSEPLAPLLQQGSELRDVSESQVYQSDGRPGTYGNGSKSEKIDYILLSPELFTRVGKAGVFRKGVWGGKNGDLWEHYDNMTDPVHAASDHAAIWAELNV